MSKYKVDNLGEKNDEALKQLMKRSAYDEDFRQKLLSDPRGAMKEELEVDVPESYQIKFVENDADVTVVLPDFVELTDDQLEAVAGGVETVKEGGDICIFDICLTDWCIFDWISN